MSAPQPRPPASSNAFGRALRYMMNAADTATIQTILFLLWLVVIVALGWAVWGIFGPQFAHSFSVVKSVMGFSPGAELPTPPIAVHPARPHVAAIVVVLCALPKVLTFVAALIIRDRTDRLRYGLTGPDLPAIAFEAPGWPAMLRQARETWDYESRRQRLSIERITQQAGVLGLLATMLIAGSVLILLPRVCIPAMDKGDCAASMLLKFRPLEGVAVAVGTSAAVFFALSMGQILVRAANSDASTKMMAWATKNLLIVGVASLFAAATLFKNEPEPSALGAVLLGTAIALLGSQALQLVTERGEQMFGIRPSQPRNIIPLSAIDGLRDEDASRLMEEGVDSVHALAFAPTPRLFFTTRYSLQRLCDWQDQALLITYVGNARTELFRTQLGIRGALDAQQFALEIVSACGSAAGGARVSDSVGERRFNLTKEDCGSAVKKIGFDNPTEAALALSTLLDDEVIRRLRVYWRCAPSMDDADQKDARVRQDPPASVQGNAVAAQTLQPVSQAVPGTPADLAAPARDAALSETPVVGASSPPGGDPTVPVADTQTPVAESAKPGA